MPHAGRQGFLPGTFLEIGVCALPAAEGEPGGAGRAASDTRQEESVKMQPDFDWVLTFNLIGTTAAFYAVAKLYVLPRLGELTRPSVLLPILLLHSLRHLGLMFLTRGAVYPGMPPQFAYPAALGDLVTALLAFASIPAVVRDSRAAGPLVWTFNTFGTLDLLVAITLATIHRAPAYMGAAYWIPAFWVPALLVTHYLTFVVLRGHGLSRARRPCSVAA
jgi:hypothetical protein